MTGRHTPSSRLAQIRFPDVVVTDSKAPAAMCKVSLASRKGCDGVISVANMKLLCETTCSLLLFIFRVWEDLNSESGVWCHSPIFHQNIWNFAFPWNIPAFILKVSQNERSSYFFSEYYGWLGEKFLSIQKKSGRWIFYFPVGLTLNNLFQDLQSQSENIPVVSTHWVIQCTVNNARIAYNNFRCKLPIW